MSEIDKKLANKIIPEDFNVDTVWREILEQDDIQPMTARETLAILFYREGGKKRYIPTYVDSMKKSLQRS